MIEWVEHDENDLIKNDEWHPTDWILPSWWGERTTRRVTINKPHTNIACHTRDGIGPHSTLLEILYYRLQCIQMAAGGRYHWANSRIRRHKGGRHFMWLSCTANDIESWTCGHGVLTPGPWVEWVELSWLWGVSVVSCASFCAASGRNDFLSENSVFWLWFWRHVMERSCLRSIMRDMRNSMAAACLHFQVRTGNER